MFLTFKNLKEHLKLSTQMLATFMVITLFIAGCKSDVEDKSDQRAQSHLTVASLTVENKQAIRETNSLSSVITKKYYSIKACLAENALGQKLDRRKVEVQGTPLRSSVTDTSGCIFWDHKFNFDYTGVGRCKVLSQKMYLPGLQIRATLNYAIDTLTDEITDLSRGKGCTIFEEEEVSADNKNDGGQLVLDRVNLYWTGLQDVKRSDKRYLNYTTQFNSCLRSRINDIALAKTPLEVTIRDKQGLHEPIVLQVQTNESGCFSSRFDSPYEQFKWSHWLEKDFNVKVAAGPLKGVQTGTLVYVNPYEPSRLIFGLDANWDPPPALNPIQKNNRIHIDGVMYIQIGNDTENFGVNDYLGLTVSKSYQVVLHPRLDLGHRFVKDKPRYVKMHDGRFRLKFMLLAPDEDDIDINENNFEKFTYITGAEKVVTLKDGVINSRMNIPVRLTDLPRLATRAVTVFKLEPISEVGLRETLVTGFFKAKITWIKTNVFQSDVLSVEEKDLESNYLKHMDGETKRNLEASLETHAGDYEDGLNPEDGSVIVEDDKSASLKKLEYKRFIEDLFGKIDSHTEKSIYGNPELFTGDSPKEIFLRHLNHKYENLKVAQTNYGENDPSTNYDMDLPAGLISKLYNQKKKSGIPKDDRIMKALMTKLCRDSFPAPEATDSFWENLFGTPENPEYMRCVRNPSNFFSTNFFMHSKKVNKIRPLYSNGMNLSIGSRFSTMSSEAETEYLSKRVGADAGLKLPFGEMFGFGIKLFDISYTWSESESHSEARSDEASTSKNLIIEKFNILVEGQFEKCLLVKGKEYLPAEALRSMGMAAGLGAAPLLLPRSYNQYNKRLNKNYYICDRPESVEVDEPWYYIQAYVPSATLLRDAYGPTEIKLIKVLRGESTFREFKKIFEDETKVYMVKRENNSETPDVKLYQNWGHLLREPVPPAVGNRLLFRNFEGSFPGTIQ